MLLAFGPGTTALGLVVRLFTRRPGQRWDDVPGHVALLFPCSNSGWNYIRVEAIGRGVVDRYVNCSEPGERVVKVHLSAEDTANWFAAEQLGERYDWRGIWIGAFCLLFPRLSARIATKYHPENVWTCSRLAAAVLLAGGAGFVRTDAPPTPNDVLQFVTNKGAA